MVTCLLVKDNILKHGKLNLIHLIEIDNQEQVMDLPPKSSGKRIIETYVEEKLVAYPIIRSSVFLNCFVSSVSIILCVIFIVITSIPPCLARWQTNSVTVIWRSWCRGQGRSNSVHCRLYKPSYCDLESKCHDR